MRIITSLIICCLFKLGRIFVNSSIPEELSFLSMQENKFKALVLDSGAFINRASITGAAEA